MSRIYWDTEAEASKTDDEDWVAYKQRAGIGLAVIYDEDWDEWEFYDSTALERLATRLEHAQEVVSYNGVSYDHIVLDAALGRRLYIPNETDLWLAIRETRKDYADPKGSWKLGEVCRRTIGQTKIGVDEGALAPSKLREGRWCEVAQYCVRDVKLLRELYRFIRSFGYVIGPDGQKVQIGERTERG